MAKRGRTESERPVRRGGFTLVEAMVAIAITAIAGSALLLAVEATQETAGDAQERAVAEGMARQLIDEILSRRYCAAAAGPMATALGVDAGEILTSDRSQLNDIDDFHGYNARPACDSWGIELGRGNGGANYRHPNFAVPAGTFANWRQQVSVYYVSASDYSSRLPNGQTSDFRAVEVGVYRVNPDDSERLVTTVRRVIAYVPPPQ